MDMKKINIGAFVVAGAMLMTVSGCTDSDFDSKYEDPSKVNQVTISNLMVGVFQKVKDYDIYEYGRFFGFDSQFVGKYAQTFGYSYSGGMYSPGYAPAIDGQWDNLYSALMQYRKMESLYNEENDTQKAQDEAFMLAAKVQLYDFFAATVDIFGDMPFFKACTLPLTNDVNGSYAPYDKAEDIYKTILDELKDIAPRFRSAAVPKNFSTQDFINLGDMEKWERYANSLRLRLAMRVAAGSFAGGRTCGYQGDIGKPHRLSARRGAGKQHLHRQPEVRTAELHRRPRIGRLGYEPSCFGRHHRPYAGPRQL